MMYYHGGDQHTCTLPLMTDLHPLRQWTSETDARGSACVPLAAWCLHRHGMFTSMPVPLTLTGLPPRTLGQMKAGDSHGNSMLTCFLQTSSKGSVKDIHPARVLSRTYAVHVARAG